MTNKLMQKRDEMAEEYINESVPHTKRDKPAWQYSVKDYKKGFDAAIDMVMEDAGELVDALNDIYYEGKTRSGNSPESRIAEKALAAWKEKYHDE